MVLGLELDGTLCACAQNVKLTGGLCKNVTLCAYAPNFKGAYTFMEPLDAMLQNNLNGAFTVMEPSSGMPQNFKGVSGCM